MRRTPSRPVTATILAVAVIAAACGGPPAVDDPTSGAAAGEAASAGYDPRQDSLVNPDSMFEPAPADPAAIARDDTLFRTLDGNPNSLNPLFISSTVEFYLSNVLFDGLFTFDREMSWMVNDKVVASFEESPDHLVYTVRLKPGLTWQDGHPFTAHDVQFSYEQIMDERVPCPAVRAGTDELAKVEALGELTVEIRHKKAQATNKWNASFPIIPKHLYEKDKANNPDLKSGDYYNELNRAPIGNGAFRFVKWDENDKIVVERWDDYHGDEPHFARHVFRIIPDNNILLLSFNKGDTDEFRMEAKQFATQTGPGTDFAKVGHKVWQSQWTYLYICWNMTGSNPFFADKRVRTAMTHALDIDRIVRDLAYNLYEPSKGPFHADSWMHDPSIERLPFDLDRAAALLEEAGWLVDEEREGWRHRSIDGKPVKFEFTLGIPQGASISRDIAAIYQEDLRSIGVDMKTQIMEWATFVERNRKHEFQASIAAWGTGVDPDTSENMFTSKQFDPEGRFGRNYGGYMNDRVDELYEMGKYEFDPEKRRAIYQEIHRLIYDDQPYTFVYFRGTFWALHNRIRGVTAGPRGIFNFNPAEFGWWVPAGQAKVSLAGKQ